MIFFIAYVLVIIQSSLAQEIQWQSGGWAFACDFKNNDLMNVKIPGSQCGGKCAATQGCTHFTWTSTMTADLLNCCSSSNRDRL